MVLLDRRSFLGWAALTIGCKGAHDACASGAPIFEPAERLQPAEAVTLMSDPFTLGVASGDPLHDRVIIWTRLAPDPQNAEAGFGAPDAPVPVAWRISRDPEFREVISQGLFMTSPQLAHAVHVDVLGLAPDSWYFYRFEVGGYTSPTGRMRTLPCPDDAPERLRFAFASCQRYRAGYYTAYAHMAEEELDLVLFLGDYIYESSGGSPIEARDLEKEVAQDLASYRRRYALYKSDAHLQAAHARFSWILTWDDHEVENDYASGYGQSESEITEAFLLRRAAAYQAYYEHQPIRAPAPEGPDMQIYRSFQFGDLADLFVLDTRQYRDDQACGGKVGPVCEARDQTERSIMGEAQERWLFEGLRGSTAAWRLIAQQVVMATLDFEGTFANHDQWDGYTASRQRLLDVFREVEDVVVLSGDIHVAMVADLNAFANAPSRVVATELVCTSISSGGDEDPLGDLSEGVKGLPNVRYLSGEGRGYVRCELDRTQLLADLRTVSTVLAPTAEIRTQVSFRIARGEPGAVLV